MSGLIGLNRPRGEYKTGDVIQVKSCHINTDITTNTSQQVIFGCHSSNNLMQINPGNRVHVHVHFQAYTGANAGGYAWVSRGLGRGNSSSNTVRGDWYSHGDNLNSVCGDGGTMDPHIYTTSAGHTYFHFSMNFLDPNPKIISNVTAKEENHSETIKSLLIKQITARVRWRESVNYMIQNDINKFIEIGPGKVLTGLVKKIDRNVNIESINSVSEVESYKI